MRPEQLARQRVQRVEPSGALVAPQLVTYGIHGGNDYVTALRVGDAVFERLPADPLTGAPAESVDALRVRAAAVAQCDTAGRAIGYFVYSGLPPEHCAP